MKKISLFFILFSGLVGLSNTFAQDVQLIPSLQKDKKTLYNPAEKNLIWKPDTAITYNTINLQSSRYSFTYDDNGNMLTEIIEHFESDIWVNFRKTTYTYNDNGNVLTMLIWGWGNGHWTNYLRYTYTYDDIGFQVGLYEELESSTWTWIYVSRFSSTYDDNGNRLTDLIENWGSDTWRNHYRDTYFYDNNGNITTELREYWGQDNWINSSRQTYTYNGSGNMLTQLTENWESEGWGNSWRKTHTFNDNGNVLTGFIEEWNDNVWSYFSKYTYTYDVNGNMLTELKEKSGGVSKKETYTYDGNGNSVTGLCENWEWSSSTWQPNSDFLDLYCNRNYVLWWYEAYRYEASFTSFTNNISSIQNENSIIIYPNPATEQVFLSLSDYRNTTVEIYNIQGQLCQSQSLESNETVIKIHDLPKGLYMLNIKSSTSNEVRKFIKE